MSAFPKGHTHKSCKWTQVLIYAFQPEDSMRTGGGICSSEVDENAHLLLWEHFPSLFHFVLQLNPGHSSI